jgi:hypothetical protein
LSQGLSQVLGFDSSQPSYNETALAPYPADIDRGFTTLFVYCNLCEEQIVGDHYVPLLRTVFIDGKRGESINKIYDQPHYVPVNSTRIHSVEINIKNDLDELVSFHNTAKVLCKLHFRQKAI